MNANQDCADRPIHVMHLDPEPFEKIKSGEKTVELRLFDEKRAMIRPGDVVRFLRNGEPGTMIAEVTGVCRFKSFEELFAVISPSICGYDSDESPERCAAVMARYYSPENQAKYGAVGLAIRLTD